MKQDSQTHNTETMQCNVCLKDLDAELELQQCNCVMFAPKSWSQNAGTMVMYAPGAGHRTGTMAV